MLPLLVWLTPDLRIKKSLLKCNWTIRKRLPRCKMRLKKRLLAFSRRLHASNLFLDRKSGSAGMPRPISYAVFCLKKKKANSMVRATLKHFSGALGQYPCPQVSAVEGLIEGMEYPMVIYCPSLQKREDQYWVLMHELGHQWFPMQVGSDERRYPWMDEGFNTFADYDAAEAFFKGTAYGDTVRRELLGAYAATALPGSEQPMITKPDEVRQLYWTAYQKPALMLSILRDAVVGRDEFDRAFREYARRWKGQHPQPADFSRTISNVTGRDLDWFWRGWIYTTARLDQAVDSVRARDDSTFLYLSNRAQMVLPVTLELRYADGTIETRNLPVEMWSLGSRFTYRMPSAKRLASAVIDPQRIYPDIARDNNSWRR